MQGGPGTRLVQRQSQRLRLTSGLSASIRILRHDATGLTRFLEEQAAENPHLLLVPVEPAPGEWTPRWANAFARISAWGPDAAPQTERLAAAAPGLFAHATTQMERLLPSGRAQMIGAAIVQALEPSGWLGRDLAAIAAETGVSVAEVETVLRRMQQAEPTGLFARSLAECLRLQAEEAEQLDPVMDCTLSHLDLLAEGEVDRLARLCSVPVATILAKLRLIRGFDPKPGARFGEGAAPLREPDLLVSRGPGGGWQVALNRSALPDVAIRGEVIGAEQPGAASRAALAAAKELQSQVASRNRTLLVVAEAVLAHQAEVLDRGLRALRPLRLADVAAQLGMHQSTISRTVAGISLETPRGTLWLRTLFGGKAGAEGRKQAAGAGPDEAATAATVQSAEAVRAQLAALVAAEDPHDPLSDDRIGAALGAAGVAIARRTVAKYRSLLGIPPAHRRRLAGRNIAGPGA
ncbi:MAG: RNA polymerase factor sigma-54 [Pseudorhodobacter sp.]